MLKNLDSLNQDNLVSSVPRLEDLFDQIQDTNKSLPEKINKPAINARMKVLITTIGLLLQEANSKNYSTSHLNTGKKQISIAQHNLITQINERFLEIPENIAEELLKENLTNPDTD